MHYSFVEFITKITLNDYHGHNDYFCLNFCAIGKAHMVALPDTKPVFQNYM